MENNADFRNKYGNMSVEDMLKLPEEELIEVSKVRYNTGKHAGNLHYIAIKAQHVLYNRRYYEQISPSEVKIIRPAKKADKEEVAAKKNLSNMILHPKVPREKMIETLRKEYSQTYFSRIIEHQYDCPQEQDYNKIIRLLRKLFPSTYDFREAKKMLAIDSLDRLETLYTANFLDNLWQKRLERGKENWKKSILEKYGSWQEYFKACGWIEHKGSYFKPELIKKTADPDVLRPFHVVTHRLAKRKGYRGKKSELKEKAVLEEKKLRKE